MRPFAPTFHRRSEIRVAIRGDKIFERCFSEKEKAPRLSCAKLKQLPPEVAHENHGACEAGNLPGCREKESRRNKTSSAASAGRGSAVGTGPLLGTGQRGCTRTRKADRKESGRVESPS